MKLSELFEHTDAHMSLLKQLKIAAKYNPENLPSPYFQYLAKKTKNSSLIFLPPLNINYNTDITNIFARPSAPYSILEVYCTKINNVRELRSIPIIIKDFFLMDNNASTSVKVESDTSTMALLDAAALWTFPKNAINVKIQVEYIKLIKPFDELYWTMILNGDSGIISIIKQAAKQHPANATWPFKINN